MNLVTLTIAPATGHRRRAALALMYAALPEEERIAQIAAMLEAAACNDVSLDGLLLAELDGKAVGAMLYVLEAGATARFVGVAAVDRQHLEQGRVLLVAARGPARADDMVTLPQPELAGQLHRHVGVVPAREVAVDAQEAVPLVAQIEISGHLDGVLGRDGRLVLGVLTGGGVLTLRTVAAALVGFATPSQAGLFSIFQQKPKIVATVSISQQKMFVDVTDKRGRTESYVWDVSTGASGFETPTGKFQPTWLSKNHKSKQYDDAPMPFAVFFNEGIAIHATEAVSRLGQPYLILDRVDGAIIDRYCDDHRLGIELARLDPSPSPR